MEAGYGNLMSKINHLKEEIEADQVVKIMEKLNKNQKKVQRHIHGGLSETFEVNPSLVNNVSFEVPRLGIESSLCIVNRFLPDSADNAINVHEVIFAKSIKLPKIQRIPTYTTWIFLDRNQRMAENQTVVGRRRIYYDGDEALVCSDSEDDFPEIEEEKHDFSDVEDRFLWMAFQEHGSDDDVATVVSHFIEASPVEIQERYKEIKLKFELSQEKDSPGTNMFLEKSLGASLDSFDNLFCRRCLVFDCRLHGCSQNLIYPSEKQLNWSGFEDMKPCSDQCYLLVRRTTEKLVEGSDSSLHHMDHVIVEGENRDSSIFNFDVNVSSADVDISCSSKSAAGEGSTAELLLASTVVPVIHTNSAKRKISDDNDRELEEPGSFENSIDKKRMKILAIEPTTVTGETPSAKATSSDVIKTFSVDPCQYMDHQLTCKRPLLGHTTNIFNDVSSQNILSSQPNDILVGEVHDINRKIEQKLPSVFVGSQSRRLQSSCEWKSLENDLFLKGLEIFGRNSCLITRNLLSGLKTCNEVYNYMRNNRALMTHKMNTVHSSEDNAGVGSDNLTQEILMRSRSRLIRKRGKTRRLKYSTKSNGHPSSWKRVGDADQSCKQYTPCACKFMCGKDCSCLKKGTYCEKYCGCSKDCKSRFRGCQCAKSQCRSRQCPCYAANRECDPDVCRNCWVSCGGGSLGEPPKRGDGQCGNMRLLLRQQQRILLGRSKVAGWGAFIKNSVNKHDYLGEYTGELISHREADKRGKTYDRSNSSFLFDLNDEYVLDACRQGDKLKFANHSSKPNCYCRIIMVAGDHRVGIFAKERIEALDELFYDYRYGPNEAPAWARPGASKKGDFLPSQSRARKHQSR